tara:strand:- start:918 stop:1625 length:708 start_codon:yes stop_codon:yes gene_type:complete
MVKIYKVIDTTDKNHIKHPIFDLPFKLAIVGKSQISLGKTSIVLNMLLRDEFYKKQFKGENIWIVTNNKLDNKLKILKKEKDIPDENFMVYDEMALEDLYEMIEDEFQEEKKKQQRLIIFDDVAYSGDLKSKESGIVSKIVMNGRHAGLSSIFTSQKYSLLGTNIRSQLTGAMLGNASLKEIELISTDLNFLSNPKEFMRMYKAHTNGRDFLVLNFTNDDSYYMDKEFNTITEFK